MEHLKEIGLEALKELNNITLTASQIEYINTKYAEIAEHSRVKKTMDTIPKRNQIEKYEDFKTGMLYGYLEAIGAEELKIVSVEIVILSGGKNKEDIKIFLETSGLTEIIKYFGGIN